MSPEERDQVLEAFAQLGVRGDAETSDPLTTFVPLAPHRRALWPENVVVLGSRGTGKTALFRLVNDPRTASRLRSFFEDDRIPEATWIDAFSATDRHPEVGTLEAYAGSSNDVTLRAFWMTHLLRRLREEVPEVVQVPEALAPVLAAPMADLGVWLPAAEASLGAVNAALDAVDRALVAADRFVMATYDTLDRIGQFDLELRRRYLRALLALWLSLSSRYRRLRGKLFLRDDLLDAGELGFADASKLRSRAETLTWDAAELLRVAARHLAGQSEAARAWLRAVPGLELVERGEYGWMPGEMKATKVQAAFVAGFAGKVIGQGVVKGSSLEWMMGRLRDAHGRITPRVLLWFLAFAAEEAKKAPPRGRGPLVRPGDLLVSVRRTSRERVQELMEEYPLVKRVENLRGMTLWLDRALVEAHLAKSRADEPPGIPARGDVVLAELLRLGVLREREDGKLDVPDIYRYAFEITPDYSSAWKDLLIGDEQRAREQFVREAPILGEILRRAARTANIAAPELQRGDYAAARAKVERALRLAENAKNWHGELELRTELGQINLIAGDFDRAQKELQRAVELSRKIGSQTPIHTLWVYGKTALLRGDYREAKVYLTQAILAAREQNHAHMEAMCGLELGRVDLEDGQPDRAVEQLKQALCIAQQEEDSVTEWLLFEELAEAAASLRSPRESLQLLTLAERIAKKVERDNSYTSRLNSTKKRIASESSISAHDLRAIEIEAQALYAGDRGWSLVRTAFPDSEAGHLERP